ncbi:hypothetical protein COO60DRAFT_962168 [Scenedesmus sp. NREL 46B-D3]|nr:hypothetical protein COO60DRAFT_962168 [Scenedesmus sp. NREL 46B-D3]
MVQLQQLKCFWGRLVSSTAAAASPCKALSEWQRCYLQPRQRQLSSTPPLLQRLVLVGWEHDKAQQSTPKPAGVPCDWQCACSMLSWAPRHFLLPLGCWSCSTSSHVTQQQLCVQCSTADVVAFPQPGNFPEALLAGTAPLASARASLVGEQLQCICPSGSAHGGLGQFCRAAAPAPPTAAASRQ